MAIPGSDWLVKALHVASQSLLVPVIAGLLAFFVYALVELGALLSEYRSRRRVSSSQVGELLHALETTRDAGRALDDGCLSEGQREAVGRILQLGHMSPSIRKVVARRVLEEEELKRARILDRTDLMARLGPALGLMGTLIPLGPGLAALGNGDVRGLAQAVIIAFDTTVVGLAVGGLAFFVSRMRRRWYEDYMATLESVVESVLEVLEDVEAEKEKVVTAWRG